MAYSILTEEPRTVERNILPCKSFPCGNTREQRWDEIEDPPQPLDGLFGLTGPNSAGSEDLARVRAPVYLAASFLIVAQSRGQRIQRQTSFLPGKSCSIGRRS
jgi:hypothetical protein